jgi:hypothetical protein
MSLLIFDEITKFYRSPVLQVQMFLRKTKIKLIIPIHLFISYMDAILLRLFSIFSLVFCSDSRIVLKLF